MIAAKLDTAADAAAARYSLFLHGLEGAYQNSFFNSDMTAARSVNRLEATGFNLAKSWSDTEAREIEAETMAIARDAHQATSQALGVATAGDLPDELGEHLLATQSYLSQQLVGQSHRDVHFAGKQLRANGLQIAMAARARGVSYRTAEIQHRANTDGSLTFQVRDRAGRRLNSQHFVRTMWRQHLLNTHNEAVMTTLARHGHTTAKIEHPDPQHRFAGQVVSLIPSWSAPSYDEIKDEAFHPNSLAQLGVPDA